MSPSRRRFLALATASLAGCLDGPGRPPDDATTPATDTPDDDTPTPSPTPEPARFEVVGLSAPAEAVLGERLTPSVTVRNVGGRAGRATVPLAVDRGDGDWHRVATLESPVVRPGTTATVESPPLAPSTLPALRLRAGDRRATVVVDSPVLEVGEPFTTRSGVTVAVRDLSFAASYEYHVDGTRREAHPAPGRKWALVDVEVDNTTDGPAAIPTYEEFALVRPVSGSQYDPVVDRNEVSRYRGGTLVAGADRSGRVVFEVPEGVSADDLRVAWTRTYGDLGSATVYWQPR